MGRVGGRLYLRWNEGVYCAVGHIVCSTNHTLLHLIPIFLHVREHLSGVHVVIHRLGPSWEVRRFFLPLAETQTVQCLLVLF